MAKISEITTGEQTVTASGAVTGSLTTATLTGDYTVKVRVRGLGAGEGVLISIQDTASVTAFSDANNVAVFHVVGGLPTEGVTKEWREYEIPLTRFGSTNNALRAFCTVASGTPTAYVLAWLEQ